MMNSLKFLILMVVGLCLQARAQSIPVISATSPWVDIREGKDFFEKNWQIAPEYNPDIYESSKVGEWLTFYTDLDSIRYQIHPDSVYDFMIILNETDTAYTQIRYAPSHLDILKGAAEYDSTDHAPLPSFFYQDSSDAALRTLRQTFNLDSIAGLGNEVSRMIHLMHWIHNLIPHDGNHENPIVRNAISMVKQCRKESRGLNCRGLALVLNECYLAVGMKSRIVTCMPKDSVFNDCHVINIVYSQQLNKWIWMDPTHDAYIMDEKGRLLGISEVREKLITGQPLILNPDANWNRRSSTLKENYLDEYMAKNLYRLSCPLRSEYNYETQQRGRVREYVELLPLDGLNQIPKTSEEHAQPSGTTFKFYKTNNPLPFWAPPSEQ